MPDSPSPLPAPNRASLRTRTPEVLAQVVTEKIKSGQWTRQNFPTVDQLMALLPATRDRVRETIRLLQRRGVLIVQPDPTTGGRIRRPLPAGTDGSVLQVATAAQVIATEIQRRITVGDWAGHRFPPVTTIRAELGCGLHTVCRALRLLEQDGVVHKIDMPKAYGLKGRDRVWRPVDVQGESTADVVAELEKEISEGSITGELPSVVDMAADQHVGVPAIAEMYQRLSRREVIAYVWLPSLSRQAWYVMDERTRTWPRGSKAMAIAADLLRRMPEWLKRVSATQWVRRPIPTREELSRQYTTHVYTVLEAQELLQACGVLERAPIAKATFLPVPPSNLGECGVTFPAPMKRHAGRWFPAARSQPWRPLPVTQEEAATLAQPRFARG